MDVRAFGSPVKHTAKPYSDLDLTLITNQPLSFAQLAAITAALATSDLPIRVNVVDWASASEAFRKHIALKSVVVQKAKAG